MSEKSMMEQQHSTTTNHSLSHHNNNNNNNSNSNNITNSSSSSNNCCRHPRRSFFIIILFIMTLFMILSFRSSSNTLLVCHAYNHVQQQQQRHLMKQKTTMIRQQQKRPLFLSPRNNHNHNINKNENNNYCYYPSCSKHYYYSTSTTVLNYKKKSMNPLTDMIDSELLNESGSGSSSSSYARPVIQWYPGHIAKAEKLLQETFFKAVDVVVEVRDARAIDATSHPLVPIWSAGKPRIVTVTHVDHIPILAQKEWKKKLIQFLSTTPKVPTITNTNNNNNDIDQSLFITTTNDMMDEYDDDSYDNADEDTVSLRKQMENQAKQAALERIKYSSKEQKDNNTNNVVDDNEIFGYEDMNMKKLLLPTSVLFVDAQKGNGIFTLKREIMKVGEYVQEKRLRKNLNSRPLRVGIIGYPNVGKSTLINRLLGGKKRVKTANIPGVTRSLQWIRIKTAAESLTNVAGSAVSTKGLGGVSSNSNKKGKTTTKDFELLDTPGVIPSSLNNQNDALLLAACNCIGDAAYDNQAVAANLCQWLLDLCRPPPPPPPPPPTSTTDVDNDNDNDNDNNNDTNQEKSYNHNNKNNNNKNKNTNERTTSHKRTLVEQTYAPYWRSKVIERYKFDPYSLTMDVNIYNPNQNHYRTRTGEDMLFNVANILCQGNPEDAARKIIQDYRTGRMGPICLQIPKKDKKLENSLKKNKKKNNNKTMRRSENSYEEENEEESKEFANVALKNIQERGLELPPLLLQQQVQVQVSEEEEEEEKVVVVKTQSSTETIILDDQEDSENTHEDPIDSTTATATITKPSIKGQMSKTSIIGKGLFDGW